MQKKRFAAEIMSRRVITTSEDVLLTDVIEQLLRYNVSCLPVVDNEGTLLGVITEYDVMNFALSGEANRTTVGESMSRNLMTFAPTDDLETIVNTCTTKRLHRAPVVENGKLVGIISRRDILREMLAIYRRV